MQQGGDLGFRWNSRLVPMSWSQTWTFGSNPFLSSVFWPSSPSVMPSTGAFRLQPRGFQVAEERVTQDGSIELVVTRWDA